MRWPDKTLNLFCGGLLPLIVVWLLLVPGLSAQTLPDAPAPQNNAPGPATVPQVPDHTSPAQPEPSPRRSNDRLPGTPEAAADPASQQPAPQPRITTLEPGQTPSGQAASREELFKLSSSVNFVQIPVMVKDPSGYLVNGLLSDNFAVLENGVRQKLTFFTSDPFPISAAVIVYVDMPSNSLDKVKQTFSALTGAFSQYDEMAIYIYGNTVRREQDFLGALSDKTSSTLRTMRKLEGVPSGPAIADSPMTIGPAVNGRSIDPHAPTVPSAGNRAYTESAVLNDAIFRASADLARRDPTRRRILFVISDGREQGSNASYDQVLKLLLSNNITLFAVGVDTAGMPIYNRLAKLRLPRQGYGNILPKYASATGGEVLGEFNRQAIETAYSRLTEEARNQYTLGYSSNAPQESIAYRSIDVRVNRPNLRVHARDGYYPAGPPQSK